MRRISRSWWTFHVAATAFGKLLTITWSWLLAPSPTVISKSIFQHSPPPTVRTGLLAITDDVGMSPWREGAAALWNASMDDITSTYFLTTHNKTSLCKFDPNIEDLLIFMKKLGFVSILD
jgi:hypothetical protein